jgi:hypothetical protein
VHRLEDFAESARPEITTSNATRNSFITISPMLWKGNTEKRGVIDVPFFQG